MKKRIQTTLKFTSEAHMYLHIRGKLEVEDKYICISNRLGFFGIEIAVKAMGAHKIAQFRVCKTMIFKHPESWGGAESMIFISSIFVQAYACTKTRKFPKISAEEARRYRVWLHCRAHRLKETYIPAVKIRKQGISR